ncbi:cytochrome P450 [Lentinula raphanica]|nr:cytochrome P450 [Lentinula raphanica]
MTWYYLILALAVAYSFWNARRGSRQLIKLATAGYASNFLSYITALQYVWDARGVLHNGYCQFKGRIFKVAQLDRWLVIASGHLVEELRMAPESKLSLEAAMKDILQSDYTLGVEIRQNMYHLGVIRGITTRNLNNLLLEMADEIHRAFDEILQTNIGRGSDWTEVVASNAFTHIVSRVIGRAFVGAPLCHNVDYCSMNIAFAHHVMFGAAFLNLFPSFMKPLMGKIFMHLSGIQKRAIAHLCPVIRQRREIEEMNGNKPDDMLSWLMDAAPPGHQSEESLSLRMLNVKFFALHTTATTFIHTLFHLAARTEYIQPLRSELEENLGTDPLASPGSWSVEKLEKCWKLDSFIKESLRMNGMGALSLPRMAVSLYTFSDGSTVPPGTILSAAPTATHVDPEYYDDPEKFDGFRFYKLRQSAETEADEFKHRLTSLGPAYLAFGGGRHACPGRFLASIEIKLLLVHLIMMYDIRSENEGVRPDDFWFGPVCVPSRKANVLYRPRQPAEGQ